MGAAEVLSGHMIVRAGEVVELAAAAGLDLAAAAVLLEKESGGGHNVWGHDPVPDGGFYRKGSPVTRAAYLAWKPHRARLGSQGVGPCQLTWPPFQDRADERGGCWDWRVNVQVGFEILADLIRRHGARGGFRRYNGSGPAAERYAADAIARLDRWAARLDGTAAVPAPPRPLLLRRGSRGPAVEALQLALNRSRGERLAVDGVFGPATEAAVRRAQVAARIDVDGIVGPQTRAVLGL